MTNAKRSEMARTTSQRDIPITPVDNLKKTKKRAALSLAWRNKEKKATLRLRADSCFKHQHHYISWIKPETVKDGSVELARFRVDEP